MDPGDLDEVFRQKPALHRFPGNMAKRTQAVSQHLVDEYDGDPDAIWATGGAGEVMSRLVALPGFGDYKSRLTMGVLVRRYGIEIAGSTPFLPDWPSIADIETPEDLGELKARKKAWKESRSD